MRITKTKPDQIKHIIHRLTYLLYVIVSYNPAIMSTYIFKYITYVFSKNLLFLGPLCMLSTRVDKGTNFVWFQHVKLPLHKKVIKTLKINSLILKHSLHGLTSTNTLTLYTTITYTTHYSVKGHSFIHIYTIACISLYIIAICST